MLKPNFRFQMSDLKTFEMVPNSQLLIEKFPKISDSPSPDNSRVISENEQVFNQRKSPARKQPPFWSRGRLRKKSLSCESLNTAANKSKQPNMKRRKSAEQVFRISYPCQWGCPSCAFSNCPGPVRVYVSRFNEPKVKCMRDIPDGRGQITFPQSRRRELRGLVYDKDTYSLFPIPPSKDLRKEHFTRRQKIFH